MQIWHAPTLPPVQVLSPVITCTIDQYLRLAHVLHHRPSLLQSQLLVRGTARRSRFTDAQPLSLLSTSAVSVCAVSAPTVSIFVTSIYAVSLYVVSPCVVSIRVDSSCDYRCERVTKQSWLDKLQTHNLRHGFCLQYGNANQAAVVLVSNSLAVFGAARW